MSRLDDSKTSRPPLISKVVDAESVRAEASYRCHEHNCIIESFDKLPFRWIISGRL